MKDRRVIILMEMSADKIDDLKIEMMEDKEKISKLKEENNKFSIVQNKHLSESNMYKSRLSVLFEAVGINDDGGSYDNYMALRKILQPGMKDERNNVKKIER